MNKINNIKDLKVYNLSYKSAMEIFWLTKKFPREELFSLVDQIRRSSRAVPANIREGFTKRKYKNVFIKHLFDAWGSCEETRTWLDFSHDCKYLDKKDHERLSKRYDEISAMLYKLIEKWREF